MTTNLSNLLNKFFWYVCAVFKYIPRVHNVVAVNKAGYDKCITPRGSKVYRSGKDQIRLVRGQNYFICNFVGHCQSGMKIAINAA
jgi:hypothetical protein